MLKLRHILLVFGILICPQISNAYVSVSIGINVPVYPNLVVVPGYPVYYAPDIQANYFFYDGMYWVYQDDGWYQSSWYNGPWWLVEREVVPVFVLRIPVRYYRRPSTFFFGWSSDEPPRWGEHWGRNWEQRRHGWDKWDRAERYAPAPLPLYQRQYSGERYPKREEQQHELQDKSYHYQPRDPVVRKQIQEHVGERPSVKKENPQQENRDSNKERGSKRPENQIPIPQTKERSEVPRTQRAQDSTSDVKKPTPTSPQINRPERDDRSQKPMSPIQREQQAPRPQSNEDRQQSRDNKRDTGQNQSQERGQDQKRGKDNGRND